MWNQPQLAAAFACLRSYPEANKYNFRLVSEPSDSRARCAGCDSCCTVGALLTIGLVCASSKESIFDMAWWSEKEIAGSWVLNTILFGSFGCAGHWDDRPLPGAHDVELDSESFGHVAFVCICAAVNHR